MLVGTVLEILAVDLLGDGPVRFEDVLLNKDSFF